MINFESIIQQIPIKKVVGKTVLVLSLMLTTMCNTPSENNDNGVSNVDTKIPEQGQESLPEETVNSETNTSNIKLNPDLFGIWKTSEVLGDGNGDMLASEAFMEFTEDGSFSAWAGRGAGVYASWEEDRKNATKGKWRYADKTLYLIDPVSGEESGASISIAGDKFMLSNGSKKQVFVKVEL